MRTCLATLVRVTVVLATLAGVASAGPLTSDPNAMPGWQGSVLFTNTNGASTVEAMVDYAVYAPGQFDVSAAMGFPGHNPVDPSGGTGYVYAYEVLNNVSGGNVNVLNLSVGLDYLNGAVPSSATSISHDNGTPEAGNVPTSSLFIPATGTKQNAKWSFSANLPFGAHSDILMFTSPFVPQMFQAAMQGGGGTFVNSSLPSPTPEPITAVLALAGAFLLAGARHLSKRRCRVVDTGGCG